MALLFWPCMIASLIVSILALGTKQAKLLVISALLILPLSLYLAATPLFSIWGLIFPILFLLASRLVKLKRVGLALLLIAPNFVLVGWLGFVVLTQ